MQKGYLREFLRKTFYGLYHMFSEEDIDLAIRLGPSLQAPIGILIEVKSTTNKKKQDDF